jgi:biopolymer transport protein ExbD
MRLRGPDRARASFPAVPMLGLAFLLFGVLGLTGLFSSEGGLRLRFSREEGASPSMRPEEAVYVKVLPDDSILLDGEPVPLAELRDRVRAKLVAQAGLPVVLFASDDATFGAMIAVFDRLARVGAQAGSRVSRVMVPTHREVRDAIRIAGGDPFEPRPRAR